MAALLLGSLSLVGLATLLRIAKRNTVSDEYKTAMDAIRAVFRQSDPGRLQGYNPFVRGRDGDIDRESGRRLWQFLPVGLVLLTSAINAALITGTVVAAAGLDIRDAASAGLAVGCLVLSLVLQVFLADEAEKDIKRRNEAYKIGSPALSEVFKRGGV